MLRPSRRELGWLLGIGVLAAAGRSAAATSTDAAATGFVDRLPPYRPEASVSGTIRLWGHGSPKHDFSGDLIDGWIAEFTRAQPGVGIENRLYGTASAIGALYTDAGDIALLGEEISTDAARAFRRARGYAPTEISVATGSLDVDFFDYAYIIFVHRDNPLQRLSLPQLERIFGAEPRAPGGPIRRWGQLG